MATVNSQTNQVRNTTLFVGALVALGLDLVRRLAPEVPLRAYGFVVMLGVGGYLWRRLALDEAVALEDPYDQLHRWCDRIGISTPEVLAHEYTPTGQQYWLRVTGHDEQGYVMTPEMFYNYWPKFRAVAGDNCRGVFISPPDPLHGGRCGMRVLWGEPDTTTDSRWPVGIHITANHIRWCYNDEQVRAALDEAERNGTEQEPGTWAPPDPAKMVGEG